MAPERQKTPRQSSHHNATPLIHHWLKAQLHALSSSLLGEWIMCWLSDEPKSSCTRWWLTNCYNSPGISDMFTYTHTLSLTLTHTFQSTGNLILISISVVCVCVASGGWLPVGNVIPEFPSGSICPTGDREHTWTHTCMHVYWRTWLTLHYAASTALSPSWRGKTWGNWGALLVDDRTQCDPFLLERESMFGANLKHTEISQARWYKNTRYLVM